MATLAQSQITAAMERLGFTAKPSEVIGGPVQYEVTEAAAKALAGKTIEVTPDGNVTVH